MVVTRPHHWQAVADELGRAFEGSATGEVEALQTASVDVPVSWKGKGRMVALRFTLGPEDRLYHYTLVPASD